MALNTSDIKNGMVLDLDGKLIQIVEFQHVKPGKGPAFVRTKVRNVRTGAVVEKTFRAGEKIERVMIDKREMQYLYRDGDDYVFMDNSTYEQMNVSQRRPRRRRQLPHRGRRRRAADERRRDRGHRPAGGGRARPSATPSPASRATACRAPPSRPPSRRG